MNAGIEAAKNGPPPTAEQQELALLNLISGFPLISLGSSDACGFVPDFQYCHIDVATIYLRFGLCVPAACNAQDVQLGLNATYFKLTKSYLDRYNALPPSLSASFLRSPLILVSSIFINPEHHVLVFSPFPPSLPPSLTLSFLPHPLLLTAPCSWPTPLSAATPASPGQQVRPSLPPSLPPSIVAKPAKARLSPFLPPSLPPSFPSCRHLRDDRRLRVPLGAGSGGHDLGICKEGGREGASERTSKHAFRLLQCATADAHTRRWHIRTNTYLCFYFLYSTSSFS